ncbi:hypothetical protein [Streptomyces sp. NRRL S-813]|uniref:hypothetical protein n=1 Tax=Streptomyces sp. NRRL S-813 TaxID=1463919 RepID=UPI0004BEA586|nr:hypothetical protein [Streptomyces sp. NRRL S-813]
MVQNIRVTGTGQLLELSARLRRAGHENIRASFHRRLRRAAEPLRDDLQDTIRNLDIRSQGRASGKRGGPSLTTRPLRATIADAIRISVRTTGDPGARVWVDKGRLPPDLRRMPDVINDGRIRHPVFGNRKRWATQWATPGWWDKTLRTHTERITREVERVTDDVRRHLE